MIKLCRARSLLYRRQILQENIRWKALDEIYNIYMFLHRSDLNISAKFRETFSHFCSKFCKKRYLSSNFAHILVNFFRNFATYIFSAAFQLLKFCYFQIPCFHFHITLFKQILKPDCGKLQQIADGH